MTMAKLIKQKQFNRRRNPPPHCHYYRHTNRSLLYFRKNQRKNQNACQNHNGAEKTNKHNFESPPPTFSFPSWKYHPLEWGFGYFSALQMDKLDFFAWWIQTMTSHDKTTKNRHSAPPAPPEMIPTI